MWRDYQVNLDNTAYKASMDDVSSGSGMEYGTLYLTEVSRELESMSRDTEICDVHYSRRPEDDDQVNIHQENSMENWIADDDDNREEKICDGISNDDGIGEGWLQGEANDGVKSSAEEEDSFSAEKFVAEDEEEKYSADDEDKFSTEEDTKYSAEEDDTNLSTEEEAKYSADEGKSSGEEDAKDSAEEDEAKYSTDECKLSTEEEGKYSADYLDDEWLGSRGHVDGHIELRNKRWMRNNKYELGKNVKNWHSSSEDMEHTSTESEAEISEEDQEQVNDKVKVDFPSASSGNLNETAVARPVLCFDEYGNLTTAYHSPEVSTVDIKKLATESEMQEAKSNSESVEIIEEKTKSRSFESEECGDYSPCNGEVRVLRNKPKINQESGESALSDQELKHVFKEEFMTAATSRYGRPRKRKTEDGFFFGTINFNELRKITSGSPKKTKGLNVKNSPEQKIKLVNKDDRKQKHNFADEIEDLICNGTEDYKDMADEEEVKGIIPTSKVQMCETKDEAVLVQNLSVGQGDGSDKILDKCISSNHDSQRELQKNEKASKSSGKNDLTEEQLNVSPKPPCIFTQEGNSFASVATTESAESSGASVGLSARERRKKLSLRRRSELPISSGTKATESHSTTSDRLLRGRSDVCRIKRSIQAHDEVVPYKRSKRLYTNIEPVCVVNSPSTDSQDSQDECLENHTSLRESSSPTKTSCRSKESAEEELALSGVDMRLYEQKNPCKHLVGDLVWVNIRGSPLWPAMISYDPVLGQFSKLSLMQVWHKIRSTRMYHVQFFSDNALTYWIAPGNVLPFEGFVKLKEFLTEQKSKLKTLKSNEKAQTESLLKTLGYMNKISAGHKYERWIKAIEEAKAASLMDRYERIQKYALQNSEIKAQNEKKIVDKLSHKNLSMVKFRNPAVEDKPEKRKRGRPRKIRPEDLPVTKSLKSNGDSTDGEFSGFDENSSFEDKKKKADLVAKLSKEGDFAVYAENHLENFMLENPDTCEETARNKLRWKWKMSSSATEKYKSKLTYENKLISKDCDMNMLKRKLGSPIEKYEECDENDALSIKRQRTEDEVDGIRGVYKVVRNEKVCYRCEGVSVKAGADMIRCKGLCCGVFHLSCLGLSSMPKRDFKCEECQTGQHACFHCKIVGGIMQRCTVPFCGRFYHEECLQNWPQVSKQRQQERFVCPRHVCHMCAANADDMGDPVARNPPFTRCLRCPTTYHTGEDCIAAGTEEVSQSHHICTKHLKIPKNGTHHVNVNWCFCCSKGGSLLLCDQCPAAFHADCMKITAPEGGYVCEDCENGKFPIYGDVVWVKLGLYRWWPGQVLHPRYIPDNIENLQHQQGMFCVHFFGSNDYYWVTRGRAFLYQEGDKGSRAQSSKTLEMQFRRALEEAGEAYRAQKAKKAQLELRWSEKGNLKPPPYVRIDSNRPVGNVRLSKIDLAAVNRCDCDPNSENPCGSDEKCLNRMLMFECMREVCGAGDRCGNQRFQKRQYPMVCSFRTETRGWGLKTTQDIKKGEFVIEYVGELIDDEEFRRRIEEMHEIKEENYYFLTIDKDIMIDAGPKGNLARFMNHSCQPNCETQKWTVGGDTRVGLFAIEDIPAGFELTFNYNLQCVGTEKKRCCCGAPNCSSFIGVKVQKTEVSGPKREKISKQKRKRRRREIKVSEDECFRCGGPGDLILCDIFSCPKGYHLECLGLDKLPRGKWICPWHHCDECGQRSTRLNRCDFCPNSFCRVHLESNLQHIPGIGSVCHDHNSQDLETLRGRMEITAVTEKVTCMPKKLEIEDPAVVMTEGSSQCTMNTDSCNVVKCSHNGSVHVPSNDIYVDALEYNASTKPQDETDLHSPQGKITVLPLRMKTGSGRPSRLSSVGDGHENSSAVINVAGDGEAGKTPMKQKLRERRVPIRGLLVQRNGMLRRVHKSEDNSKQVNES
ncbi:histone-lysine N-methyltransferase NSD2 isoform X3 [Procambarus clarkii]|uniref:histone-lysine N-methyltransferase NSD2 isoform X3 n=2 Tax=Procambarus clarkii TaxID=6728 RepID=UPI0037426CA0